MRARIALVAEEAAGALALERCVASENDVVLLLSSDASADGSTSKLRAISQLHGIEVQHPNRVRTPVLAADLKGRGIDVLLNVHSLFLIHRDVLAAPAIGAFNLHPGPLPEYAGINTVSWAIYQRASEYGATLHWLSEGIDAGPIAYAARFPLDEGMTGARLMGRSVREGLLLVERFLAQLTQDPRQIPAISQDASQRRYYDRSIPGMGRIDWHQDAGSIEAFVRACDYEPYPSPWGRPMASIGGIDVQLTRVAMTGAPADAAPGTVGRKTGTGILVAARDEWVEVRRVQLNGRAASAADLAEHITAMSPK